MTNLYTHTHMFKAKAHIYLIIQIYTCWQFVLDSSKSLSGHFIYYTHRHFRFGKISLCEDFPSALKIISQSIGFFARARVTHSWSAWESRKGKPPYRWILSIASALRITRGESEETTLMLVCARRYKFRKSIVLVFFFFLFLKERGEGKVDNDA